MVLAFLAGNWVWIAPIALELAARFIPSKKNMSLVDNAVKIIGYVLPNIKKGGGRH